MASNRWIYESSVPRKAPQDPSFGFVVIDRELYVIAHSSTVDRTDRRSRHHKRAGTLYIQVYHPKKKTWRSIATKLPFNCRIDINRAILCSICL